MQLELADLAVPSKGGFYYLATPYTKWRAGPDDACRMAAELAGEFVKLGIPVFSPIAHAHVIATAAGIDPLDHKIWLPADKPFVAAAIGLVVAAVPGWRESYGVGQEIEWFTLAKKPRFLLNPDTLKLQPLP